MTRKTYRVVHIEGEMQLVEVERLPAPQTSSAPAVWGDIKPYQSMVTGEIIGSRSTHRDHLRAHKMVEVGNETKYLKARPPAPPPGLKQTLIDVVNSKL